jgi:hypothetical protein
VDAQKDPFREEKIEKIRQVTVNREAQEKRLRDQLVRQQEIIDAWKAKQN